MKQQYDLYRRNFDNDTLARWRIDRDHSDKVVVGIDLLRDPERHAAFVRIRDELSMKGFALFNNSELGLDNDAFLTAANTLFDDRDIVTLHPGDVPATRRRARDVVTWEFDASQVTFGRFPTNRIEDERRFSGNGQVNIEYSYREISRFNALSDDVFVTYLAGLLSVMPACLQYDGAYEPTEIQYHIGTLSLNAFETYGEVVQNRLHHDQARIIATTVIDRQGEGGHSLLKDVKTGEMVMDQALEPGQTLLFFDEVFLHGATDVQGQTPRRRALITTLDLLDTYF